MIDLDDALYFDGNTDHLLGDEMAGLTTELSNALVRDGSKVPNNVATKRGFFNIYVKRRQFPVTPVEAVTPDKIQGGTYVAVAVNYVRSNVS